MENNKELSAELVKSILSFHNEFGVILKKYVNTKPSATTDIKERLIKEYKESGETDQLWFGYQTGASTVFMRTFVYFSIHLINVLKKCEQTKEVTDIIYNMNLLIEHGLEMNVLKKKDNNGNQ